MVTRAYLLQQEVGMKSFLSYGLTSSVVLDSLLKMVMSSHIPSLLELTRPLSHEANPYPHLGDGGWGRTYGPRDESRG